ncbi:MAG: DHHW family protein, partial [Limosilactobacillus sp.]|nr:DHHW family protein [Limosilactobacillus sp.]
DRDGQTQSAKIIADATQYDEANKYMTFIAGDQPFEEINNPKLHDGSSIVIVKESFGNAFTPFLVNNFEHVYVVDYRYYDGKLAELVRDKHIQNVVFLNNISAASTDTLVGSLIDLLK